MASRFASSAPSPASPRPSSPGSAACIATPSSTRQNCSTRNVAAQGDAALSFCRTDHRLRGLHEIGGDRPSCRPLRRCRSAAERPLKPPPTAHRRLLLVILPRSRNDQFRPTLFSADEPRISGSSRRSARAECAAPRNGALRACACRPQRLDRRGHAARGRVMQSSSSRRAGKGACTAYSCTKPRMMECDQAELAGRWRGGVVLSATSSPSTWPNSALPAGEVEAVLRRLDRVPWWSIGLALICCSGASGAR